MNKRYVLVLAGAVLIGSVGLAVADAQTPSFTANLAYGITGSTNVQNLQEFLTTEGFYSGPVNGNFLSLTLAAVKNFQVKNNIKPASGYFGPLTRAQANATLASEIQTYQSQIGPVTSNSGPTPPSGTATALNLTTLLQARIGNLFNHYFDLKKHSGNQGSTSGSGTGTGTSTSTASSTGSTGGGTGTGSGSGTGSTGGTGGGTTPAPLPPTTGVVVTNMNIVGGIAQAGNFNVKITDTTANSVIFSGPGTGISQQATISLGDSYSVTEATTSASAQYIVALGTGCSGSMNTTTITCTITDTFVTSPVTPPVTPTSTPTSTPIVSLPVVTSMQWGAYVGDGTTALSDFESLAGKPVNIEATFSDWQSPFPSYFSTTVGQNGKTLIIFWEPGFGYSTINNGTEDSYITQFATAAKAYGYPVILAPFDEMNLNENAWGAASGNTTRASRGNTTANFIQAWQHVHDLFVSANATNVKFGWDVNSQSVPDTSANSIASYYPGNAYVDYVGVDGFNFGNPIESFGSIFDAPISQLETYGKPIYIFSMGSFDYSGKVAWVTDALGVHIKTYANVAGWIWFNQNDATAGAGDTINWTINSDPLTLAAFKAILP